MLLDLASLCRARRSLAPARTPAGNRGFSTYGDEFSRETGSHLTLRWREMDSNFWYRGTKTVDFRSIPGMAGDRRGLKRDHLIVQPFFFCASNHSNEPG